jgi:acetyl-CoA acyltransferase
MWISYSPDLVHWGDHRVLIQARRGGWWDARKIGLSPQPIETKDGMVDQDGGIRPDTSAEALAGLKPAFSADGTVTAGTSSPLTDGASAVLVCTAEYAEKNKLDVIARVKGIAGTGLEPEIMGMGPVEATNKALARAGLKIDDIDVMELNEAFASQALACIHELGIDPAKVNLDGGAIALGHPLGASGAKLMTTLLNELERTGGRYGLQTMCEGGGMANATIIERLD